MITKPIVLRLRGMFEAEALQMLRDFIDSNEDAKNSIKLIRDLDQAAVEAVKIA